MTLEEVECGDEICSDDALNALILCMKNMMSHHAK